MVYSPTKLDFLGEKTLQKWLVLLKQKTYLCGFRSYFSRYSGGSPMSTKEEKDESSLSLSRRDMLRILGGVAAANGLGAATWGTLELLIPPATADTWHKSVCRYCGTGCGVLVGMRKGLVTDIRGDELAHNKG